MGYPRNDDRDDSSGVTDFLIGSVLAAWGAYMVCERMVVQSHFRISFYGRESGFFPVFSVFLLGMFLLGLGRTWLARVFIVGGASLTLWGALNSLDIHFMPASLVSTVIMFSMLVGGVGLVTKALLASRS
jgi:hypothetical protein